MIRHVGSKAVFLLTTGVLAGGIVLTSPGCRRMTGDDEGQIASAVGEAMASMDESVQGGTPMALLPALPVLRTPDEFRGPLWRRAVDAVLPSAHAAACWPSTFTACAGGVRTRQFESCALGAATLTGSVTLTFNRAALCVVATDGDSVTRTADFTLTGPYGGTLTVTSPGGGQTLAKTATGFEYTVQGMQRVLAGPAGRKIFDVSTRTTTPIVVTGTSRADLVIVSGALEVSHNLAGYKVTLVPQNLAWTASCNCAVSGSLTGTVAGGKADGKSASVTLTGCGHADLTIDGDTESITLDRCAGI